MGDQTGFTENLIPSVICSFQKMNTNINPPIRLASREKSIEDRPSFLRILKAMKL